MEKSINITINNTVFSINEDAYNKLDEYLESIKKHYGNSKEGQEILVDIESSIAEKFSGKVSGKKQSVNLKDVDEVIKVMGTVNEIESSSPDIASGDSDGEETGEKDESAFVTISVGTSASETKKLYRDSDDQILAGVCSGLAAYFGIDSVFIRIAFVLLTLVNGMGILAYIILWIVMPQAKTGAQKLQMRGKPVNIKKIEQVVKEKSKMIKKEGKQALEGLSDSKAKDVIYKILNFQIKVLEVIFIFLKKFLRVLGPFLSIFFGVILVVGMVLSILGLTTAAGVMIFNINSEYIVSDIPLQEISHSVFYHLGVVSGYLTILIPLIFVLILGITMADRKNVFRSLFGGVLIAVWMLAIVGCVVAAGDLVPTINSKMAEIQKNESIEREFDYSGFNKLYIAGRINVDIKQGNNFSITMNGRETDLDRLEFEIEDGQLQITQKAIKEEGKICIFCFNREIEAEIVLPELNSLVGTGNSKINVKGFDQNIYISLGESSRANFILEGQDVECCLAGAGSRLELTGKADKIDCKLIGISNLVGDDLIVGQMKIDQEIIGRVKLSGQGEYLRLKAMGNSRFNGSEMKFMKAEIVASSNAKVEVYVQDVLKAVAEDSAKIIYQGNPQDKILEEIGNGRIDKVKTVGLDDFEFEDIPEKEIGELKINISPEKYASYMSSVRGFTLIPVWEDEDFEDGELEFIWLTDGGGLIEDWNELPNLSQKIVNQGEEVYWTIDPDKWKSLEIRSKPIQIDLKIQKDGRVVKRAQVKLIWNDKNGLIEVARD